MIDTTEIIKMASQNSNFLMQTLPQFVSGCGLVVLLALLVWRYLWR